MTLSRVAEAVGGRLGGEDRQVDVVATDTRRMPAGESLFVALRGMADGHDHVGEAAVRGAVAALVERDDVPGGLPLVVVNDTWAALLRLAAHVRDEIDPTTVAITGSVGKTTVKDLVAAAMGTDRQVHASRASFNNELGVPLTLLDMPPDTDVLVAEIGARHVGDIARLAAVVRPEVSVVTAVAPVHLEIFGTLEAIAAAKGELVDALHDDGMAVLNVDFEHVAHMAEGAPNVLRVATTSDRADVRAESIELDDEARATARVVTPWGRVVVRPPLPGRHQVVNALLALTVAGHLGADLDVAAEAISAAPTSPWRGEIVRIGPLTVLDDAYNANPTSVRAALRTLIDVAGDRRTTAVLGLMAEIGPTSDEEHRRVGEYCGELGVHRVVAVGKARAIARGARSAGVAEVTAVDDAHAAVAVLGGDDEVVLVKGSRVAGLENVARELRADLGGEVAGA